MKRTKLAYLLLWSILAIGICALGYFAFTKIYRPDSTIHPRRGEIVETIYGLGTITPASTYQVRAGITLSVTKLYVKEGDVIRKGDPLIQLDDNLSRSPIDGTVTNVSYMEGEIVAPQARVLTVTNLKNLYLEVSLEQQSILRVKRNQSVLASFESLRQEKYKGRVQSIFPRDSQFIVHIDLTEWPPGALPGVTADVAIIVDEKKDALLIPIDSLKGGMVKRRRGAVMERVPVKLGSIADGWGEVTSGDIQENDEIILGKK